MYKALRRAIIEQALRPGMKLPEDSIGEQLGVSRTLVREAFGRLAVECLVELKPNRGPSVAYPTLEEARDFFEVRRGLEQLVVESLAGRLTPFQVAELEAHASQKEKAHEQHGPEGRVGSDQGRKDAGGSQSADAAVFGIDLGKTRFDVMAVDASGKSTGFVAIMTRTAPVGPITTRPSTHRAPPRSRSARHRSRSSPSRRRRRSQSPLLAEGECAAFGEVTQPAAPLL